MIWMHCSDDRRRVGVSKGLLVSRAASAQPVVSAGPQPGCPYGLVLPPFRTSRGHRRWQAVDFFPRSGRRGRVGARRGSYSDRWQLVINTATTIVTFLMVFLIQNTQNREAKVTQLKLDELIRSLEQARNRLVAMEEMSDEELQRIEREFHQLHVEASQVRQERGARR